MAEEASDDELRVVELLRDPKWVVFGHQIGGEAHGGKIIVLRLHHPRFGIIDCQLEPETAAMICHAIHKVQQIIEGLPPPSMRMQ